MVLKGAEGHSRALPGRADRPENFFSGSAGTWRVLFPAAQGLFSGPTGPACSQPTEAPDDCGRLWTAPDRCVQFLTTSHPYIQLFKPQHSNKPPTQTNPHSLTKSCIPNP